MSVQMNRKSSCDKRCLGVEDILDGNLSARDGSRWWADIEQSERNTRWIEPIIPGDWCFRGSRQDHRWILFRAEVTSRSSTEVKNEVSVKPWVIRLSLGVASIRGTAGGPGQGEFYKSFRFCAQAQAKKSFPLIWKNNKLIICLLLAVSPGDLCDK